MVGWGREEEDGGGGGGGGGWWGGVLTLGLLRGLEDRPVDAPLTERDLRDTMTHAKIKNIINT